MDAGQSRRFTDARVPDPGISALFTEASRLRQRLRVESALAQAEAAVGVVPAAAADAISDAAWLHKLDRERIDEATATHSHPLMPLVEELARVVGEEHGGWVHWGATTQNITQTADLLLLKKAHRLILGQMEDLLRGLSKLADDSAAVPMPGRTHSQHAVPITFGFKVATWIDQMTAHVDRLLRLHDRTFRLLMGGAAGTLASFGDLGREIEAELAERLDLQPMPVPSRTTNDGMVELVTVLGLLAGTAGKIAKDVYSMMQPEFGEVFEPIPVGTIGSSTMPHKRNPQLTLDIMALSAQLRGLSGPALEAMLHDHEANGAMTGMLEDIVAQAAVVAGDILSRLVVVVDGLELDTERMAQNLELSSGLIGSENLMLSLGERIGRQKAHEVVYELAQQAATSGTSFASLLKNDPAVAEHFTGKEIKKLLDPARHLGESIVIAREMAAHARTVADQLQFGAQ